MNTQSQFVDSAGNPFVPASERSPEGTGKAVGWLLILTPRGLKISEAEARITGGMLGFYDLRTDTYEYVWDFLKSPPPTDACFFLSSSDVVNRAILHLRGRLEALPAEREARDE